MFRLKDWQQHHRELADDLEVLTRTVQDTFTALMASPGAGGR